MSNKYHAHIYFDKESLADAKMVFAEAENLSDIKLGRFHEKNIGPHLKWNFVILFGHDQLEKIKSWCKNTRRGLSVLIHPNGDDELLDHTERAIWLGEKIDLDLEKLEIPS